LFKLLPIWRHTLTIVSYGPIGDAAYEIYTNESSGPARIWNHRLSFEQTGERSCRYTDEIEIEAGLRGLPTKLFIALFFRYRHRRWRALARAIA
jgi:ligand-binding SRPBCC domain-containing protein